jgi:hypothetical protein
VLTCNTQVAQMLHTYHHMSLRSYFLHHSLQKQVRCRMISTTRDFIDCIYEISIKFSLDWSNQPKFKSFKMPRFSLDQSHWLGEDHYILIWYVGSIYWLCEWLVPMVILASRDKLHTVEDVGQRPCMSKAPSTPSCSPSFTSTEGMQAEGPLGAIRW